MTLYYLLFLSNWMTCEGTLRIIGGRDAFRNEYPYAIRLEIMSTLDKNDIGFRQLCTGAAINSEWILSAAHCYIEEYIDPNNKIVARYNSYYPKYVGEISLILEVYIHPRYTEVDMHREHDIGLFRSQNISVSQYGKISAVDYKTLIGHEVNILGFGGTNASQTDKPLQVLKGMMNKCLENDESIALIMCVVPSCGLKATICGGDSGGPVVHSSGIVGVNSRSADDCNEFTTSLVITPGTSASIVSIVSGTMDWFIHILSDKNFYNKKKIKLKYNR